jgi:hypothetical protein
VEESDVKLEEEAITAYEASQLKKAGVLNNEKSASLIRQFLSIFGLKVKVDVNPFEIDGIRIYVDPMEYVDGIHGYDIMVSRKFSNCGGRIEVYSGYPQRPS